jgi:hypothetical protein
VTEHIADPARIGRAAFLKQATMIGNDSDGWSLVSAGSPDSAPAVRQSSGPSCPQGLGPFLLAIAESKYATNKKAAN